MSVHIFGIRHHGPGSARSLRQALDTLRPDVVLVEGPPEGDSVLSLVADAQMEPPVALLVYAPDAPQHAVYYPFARFSPEWQAIRYALDADVPVRFMDLPQTHQIGQETPDDPLPPQDADAPPHPAHDPLGYLAAAAGYSDGERWWEHVVEHRRDGMDMFAAILEAMEAVRDSAPPPVGAAQRREDQREAFMRQTIRAAQAEGYERIAVICGAWHGPALIDLGNARADAALLKGLPKTKVQATWVPWTYGRLSYSTGYGAGVASPGWYDHLFSATERNATPREVAIEWATRMARLLRDEGMDTSSAHAIECVRLAETLAAMRELPLPGLAELSEAARATFCFDTDAPMHLIHRQLIVGERLGSVPDATPMVPLQQDVTRQQKRLRLPPELNARTLELDLRKPNDLEKSHLLHRMALLKIPWGEVQRSGGGKGTFHEHWRLEWKPEFPIALIEANMWGNTLLAAATSFVTTAARDSTDLPTLTRTVQQALLAGLTDAIPPLLTHLEAQAALTSDIPQMMAALPPLGRILRYGDVRNTDTGAVGHVVEGLVTRICVGLPGACGSLNDEAASAMFKHLNATDAVINLLERPDLASQWHQVLRVLADSSGTHGLVMGRSVRLLLDQRVIDEEEVARRLGLALSASSASAGAAAWVEGLLSGSGALLVHDDALWQLIDSWLAALAPDTFTQMLPLLRRTFSTFSRPERRNLGERATRKTGPTLASAPVPFDPHRAEAALPLLLRLLGAHP